MAHYLHQIVFCSDRKGRAYRREITVTDRSAMVTNIEVLPPHYEIPLERMREEDEEITTYEGVMTYWSGYQGCPFCGNRKLFICACGYLSCRSIDARPVHTCPKCEGIFDTTTVGRVPMSKSGLVHGGKTQREFPREPRPLERPLLGRVDPEKEGSREKLRKFLAEQTKKQLEDKRNKE
jgi:hypothetical protein